MMSDRDTPADNAERDDVEALELSSSLSLVALPAVILLPLPSKQSGNRRYGKATPAQRRAKREALAGMGHWSKWSR